MSQDKLTDIKFTGNKIKRILSTVNVGMKPRNVASVTKLQQELISFKPTVNRFYLILFLQYIYSSYGDYVPTIVSIFLNNESYNLNIFVTNNIGWVQEYFPSIGYFKRAYTGFHLIRYVEFLFGVEPGLRLYTVDNQMRKAYNSVTRLLKNFEKKTDASLKVRSVMKNSEDPDLGISFTINQDRQELAVVSEGFPMPIPGIPQKPRILALVESMPTGLSGMVRSFTKRNDRYTTVGRFYSGVESIIMGRVFDTVQAYDDSFELDPEQELFFSGCTEGVFMKIDRIKDVTIGADGFDNQYCYLEIFHKQKRKEISLEYGPTIYAHQLFDELYFNSCYVDYSARIKCTYDPDQALFHVVRDKHGMEVYKFIRILLNSYRVSKYNLYDAFSWDSLEAYISSEVDKAEVYYRMNFVCDGDGKYIV